MAEFEGTLLESEARSVISTQTAFGRPLTASMDRCAEIRGVTNYSRVGGRASEDKVREYGPCPNSKHWFTTSFRKVPESGAGIVSEGCGPCPVSSNLLVPGCGHNTDSTVVNWVMTSVIPDGQLAQASVFTVMARVSKA